MVFLLEYSTDKTDNFLMLLMLPVWPFCQFSNISRVEFISE